MTMPELLTGELPADVVAEAEPEPQPEPKAPEVLQTELTTAQAEIAKLRNDLKALRGLRGKESDRDSLMQDIREEIAEVKRTNAALVKALGSGNTDSLAADVSRIEGETYQQRAARNFQSQYATLWTELQAALTDEDGKAILNLQDSPELEAVRSQWLSFYNAEKMGVPERLAGFATAVAQAHTAVRRFERAAAREDAKKVRTTAAQRTKKALEEAGVHDLDTGAGTAGQHVTADNIDALFTEGRYSPAKYRHFLETGVIRQ